MWVPWNTGRKRGCDLCVLCGKNFHEIPIAVIFWAPCAVFVDVVSEAAVEIKRPAINFGIGVPVQKLGIGQS